MLARCSTAFRLKYSINVVGNAGKRTYKDILSAEFSVFFKHYYKAYQYAEYECHKDIIVVEFSIPISLKDLGIEIYKPPTKKDGYEKLHRFYMVLTLCFPCRNLCK